MEPFGYIAFIDKAAPSKGYNQDHLHSQKRDCLSVDLNECPGPTGFPALMPY